MAQQIRFALSPALVDNGVIDYATVAGQKLWKNATSPLTNALDVEADHLLGFLEELKNRSKQFGWHHILEIPANIAQPNDNLSNLLHKYGSISLAQVQAHARTYNNTQSRVAQDSSQLFDCIMASLTTSGLNKVMLRENDYVIDGVESGSCLLKVIISEAYIDTNATTMTIRDRLQTLDKYVVSVKSDIEKVNLYVKTQLQLLAARQETTHDLLSNLFRGYKAASDRAFVDYIKRKQEDYEEGDTMTAADLMDKAVLKYKSRVEKGIWNAPTEDQQRIIALEEELKQVKKSVKPPNMGKRDKT